MTRREVVLTEDAEHDLEDIYHHIAKFDSSRNADHVLDRLLAVTESLAHHPERGSCPRELQTLGDHECRQVFFKPYRAIYRVLENTVVIYVVADGRRDLQSLLTRRLLRG